MLFYSTAFASLLPILVIANGRSILQEFLGLSNEFVDFSNKLGGWSFTPGTPNGYVKVSSIIQGIKDLAKNSLESATAIEKSTPISIDESRQLLSNPLYAFSLKYQAACQSLVAIKGEFDKSGNTSAVHAALIKLRINNNQITTALVHKVPTSRQVRARTLLAPPVTSLDNAIKLYSVTPHHGQ